MTEHSIEELCRQYNVAHSRLVAAQKAEEAALARLNAAKADAEMAKLAERGIVAGVRVYFQRHRYRGGRVDGFFGGVEYESIVGKPIIFAVKKDGTPSAVRVRTYYDDLDLIKLADDDDKQEAQE